MRKNSKFYTKLNETVGGGVLGDVDYYYNNISAITGLSVEKVSEVFEAYAYLLMYNIYKRSDGSSNLNITFPFLTRIKIMSGDKLHKAIYNLPGMENYHSNSVYFTLKGSQNSKSNKHFILKSIDEAFYHRANPLTHICGNTLRKKIEEEWANKRVH